jgi:hypothetical protein
MDASAAIASAVAHFFGDAIRHGYKTLIRHPMFDRHLPAGSTFSVLVSPLMPAPFKDGRLRKICSSFFQLAGGAEVARAQFSDKRAR